MKKTIITTFLLIFFFANQSIASWDGYGDNPLPSNIEAMGSVTAGNSSLGIEVITDDTTGMQCGLGAILSLFGFDTKATYSRINSLDINGKRDVWVDEFSYSSYDGSPTIRACASQCMLLVVENCVRITTKQGSAIRAFPLKPDSRIIAEEKSFTTSSIGDTSDDDGDTTQGHRVGYVFNLYSGNCPYYNTTDRDVCMSQARNGGTITKEYIKNVPYSESNNCYEAVKTMYTSCSSEPGDCQCVAVSGDDTAKANCSASTGFVPDSSGTTWKNYSSTKKACFSCYQDARKMLHKCIRASFDLGVGYGPNGNFSSAVAGIISNMKNSIAQVDYNKLKVFRKMYGAGTYVCAYEDDESSRIGCMKIEAIQTPNPFPRIAFKAPVSASEIAAYNSDPVKASKDMFFVYSASQIFDKAPYVAEFKDEAVTGDCYGSADLGEEYRGDFFNPAMYVQYGSNRQTMWLLNSDPGTSMVKKYQTTATKCPNCGYDDDNNVITKYSELSADKILEYKQMTSEWSTEYPVMIYYGKATSTSQACAVTIDSETFKRICTRIEYDADLDEEYFKAYIVSNENAPAATCNDLYDNDNMTVLGGVIRPPLKYNYDTATNKTISPIVISSPIATDTSSQSTVYIKPQVVEYFVLPNSSSGIDKISFTDSSGEPTAQAIAISAKNLQLEFFNLKLTIPTDSSDTTTLTSLASIIENDNQCGFILGHKICIGPFLDTDCQMLTTNSNDIRSEIRFKTLTSSTKCPSNDSRCPIELKMFNALYPSCSQYKRCASGATADECSNSGNMKIAIDSVTGRTLNYNWSDGICLSRGIDRADFSQTGNVAKYGDFRNVTQGNDYVVSFSQSDYPIGMRNNGSFDIGSENLVIAGSDYFSTDSSSTKLKYLKTAITNASTLDLLQKYIGTTCDDTCISSNISVRQKNMDEMGLCVKFDRINKIDFGGVDSSYKYRSGHEYLHYIPKRCDFYEAYVLGPGGKGEQWNANARLEFKVSSLTECVGQVFKVAICYALGWLIGCDGDEEADYLVKVCTRNLNSQSGGGGGYAQGLIDLTELDSDHLIIIPGKDMSFDLPLYTTWANRSVFGDYDDIDNQLSTDYRKKYQHSRVARFNSSTSSTNILFSKRGQQGLPLATMAEGGKASYNSSFIVTSGYGLQTCPTVPSSSSAPTAPTVSSGIDSTKYPTLYAAMQSNANGTNECYTDGDMSTACLYTTSTASCVLNSYCEADRLLFLKQSNPNLSSIDATKYPYFAAAMDDNRNGKNPSCYSVSDSATYCKYNNIKSTCVLNSTCESERASYGITDEYDARVEVYESEQCYQWAKSANNATSTIACEIYNSTQSSAPSCYSSKAYNERTESNCTTTNGTTTCSSAKVYDWCCSTSTCISQASIKATQTAAQTLAMAEYEAAKAKYASDMQTYSNNVKAAEATWKTILITSINNVCPFVIKGQDGNYDWPSVSGTVREDGGGNIAMLGIKAIDEYSCTTDSCLVEKADSIEYKMTYKYCYNNKATCTLDGGQSCSSLKTIYDLLSDNTDPDYRIHRQPHSYMNYNGNATSDSDYSRYANGDSGRSNYGNNPFIGSGGCIVDSSTDNPLFNGVDTDDWDYQGDTQGNRESWGGNGWIRLGVPYVKYNSLGTVAMLSGGKKILNKSTGVRDTACVPKCPRAFVEINGYVCEYSNGDPGRLLESPVDSVINPIKCFDSNGILYIPTSGVDRTCLFTSCKEMQSTGRYSDLCTGIDIYTGRYFAWGASFFEEAVTTDEYSKYCGSSSLTLGVDYYSSDALDKASFALTCDDHGNWIDKDNNAVTYKCPYINQKYKGFISQNITSLPTKSTTYGTSSGGKTCNPFGIWVNVT